MSTADIEIEVSSTVYDGEHEDNGAAVCRLCSLTLPTSYWCDGNPQTHPGGTICIEGVFGRYVDAYEDGGWEYELDRVYWQQSGVVLDADERDLFTDEIHAAVVDYLRSGYR